MKEKRWLFIVNPAAGRGRASKELPRLEHLLRRFKLPNKVMLTRNPGHATELAGERLLKGFENICVVGGDGTLHEVVNGVMDCSCAARATLAVLPLGGGNDYARTIGVTKDWEQALDMLVQGHTRKMDVGRIERRWFINSLGVGLDARVAAHALRIKRLNGLPRYLLAVFRALAERPRFEMDVKLDDDLFRGRFMLASIGLGKFCGGGFMLNPEAVTDDGLFDLCFVDAMPTIKTMFALPLAFNGGITRRKEVRLTRSTYIEIRAKQPLPVYVDGEIPRLRDTSHMRIELHPGALRFIAARPVM